MTAHENAADAVSSSVAHTEIARCADTQDNRDWLMTHCDDWTWAAGSDSEYWGLDDNGNAWRVHIKPTDPTHSRQWRGVSE